MNEQNPEIQQLFAEEQLKVHSDETVDFPFQMDNLNQEDVHQRYQDMGMNHADAESHTNCVDFADQVREDYISEETELVRWTTQANLDNKGNYYTFQESNADPGKLGIPNSHDAFEVYKTDGETFGLVSTAADAKPWNPEDEGQIYPGGEQQIHLLDDDLDNLTKIGEGWRWEPSPTNELSESTTDSLENDFSSVEDDVFDDGDFGDGV